MIGLIQEKFYDLYIVAFSGGAGSLACLLHLIESKIPLDRVELWHHRVDGIENDLLFDWECTSDYAGKVATAFGIPVYFSWREGGLEREMLRENAPTAPIWFESPEGLHKTGGKSNRVATRLQFPQISNSLSARWCTSYSKLDVMKSAIANQERLKNKNTLIITGEYRQNSTKSKYKELDFHTTTTKSRTIHHWRPVINWSNSRIWEIIKRWSVNPHVSYKLGWNKCSCMLCIFSSDDQWASAYNVYPARVLKISDYEKRFGRTIAYKTKISKAIDYQRFPIRGKVCRVGSIIKKRIIIQDPVLERVARGNSFPMAFEDIIQARSKKWHQPIFLNSDQWEMPLGAIDDHQN
jgi:3'-phosphoadenosine 5'-phosphosulfate sulfotransferase (PAPS reductase)/FAD synthetase